MIKLLTFHQQPKSSPAFPPGPQPGFLPAWPKHFPRLPLCSLVELLGQCRLERVLVMLMLKINDNNVKADCSSVYIELSTPVNSC